MKKNYIYILLIILVLSSFIIFNNKKEDNTVIVNGTKYAISIDGESASDFPSKGAYDVLIDCTNASAEWNYDEWVAEIYNVTGSTSCSINFTSREEKKLNEYIISLTGEQGNGQVVNEKAPFDNSTFTAGSILEQNSYTVSSNDATYPFEWDSTNKTWTSTNHTDSTTSTFIFNVATAGHYQVCYKQSSEKNYDYAIFYKDNSQITSLKGISNTDFNCYYLGNLTTSNAIKVTYQKDSSSSSGSDNVIFYLQNGTYNESIQTISTGYRYEGKDPNNYIYFNNELWRIIGVFDSSSHGVSNTNLVKIIRNDSIGGYAWHNSNTNDWPNSSLYHLLNDYYYTATDGTSSSYCYQFSTSIKGNCNYTKIGLQTDYRNMVQTNTTWYLGGPSSYSNPTSTFYANERDSSKIYSGRSPSTTGNVGLMYASDYGYSVLSSSCARTTNLYDYVTNACAGNAWLKKETYEWTITPYPGNSYDVWNVYLSGYVNRSYANFGYASRPVLYLKSDVTVMGGDGSLASPYRIRLVSS